jgi:hypothetical protein
MPDASFASLVISLVSATAASAAFGVQARRLGLESAALVVTSARLLEPGKVEFTILNVGARPAFNVEASFSKLRPDVFVEGIEASGVRKFAMDVPVEPRDLMIAYHDLRAGRRLDARTFSASGAMIILGACRTSKGLEAAASHVLRDTENGG